MRKISLNFLFVFGLMSVFLGLGTISVSANSNDVITKIPKNMGVLSVTTDEPMTVYLDGIEIGTTQGNQIKFEKVVNPGIHEVRIVGTEGKEFNKTYTFVKGVRNCVCLKTFREEIRTPCPYDVSVSGPDKVKEGDSITFAVVNNISGGSTPLNYLWTVSPAGARISSGLNTSSITVETGDLGNQTITAEVDVSDGTYDAQCRQRKTVSTFVERIPEPPPPMPYKFDFWDAKAFDDDKARLDNLAIELQNKPDSQAYVIMYQGTDRISTKSLTVEKLRNRALNYLVQTRMIQPNRIQFTNWGTRAHTQYEVWIVPPGANPPVPQ